MLNLFFAPSAAASGTLTLGYSYTNNAGMPKTGSVQLQSDHSTQHIARRLEQHGEFPVMQFDEHLHLVPATARLLAYSYRQLHADARLRLRQQRRRCQNRNSRGPCATHAACGEASCTDTQQIEAQS